MGCVVLSYYCYRSRIISVGRALDCKAGGRGFDSQDRINTQGQGTAFVLQTGSPSRGSDDHVNWRSRLQ